MNRYVIMLDYLKAANPDHWPISASSNDLASLRNVRQHNGNPPLAAKGDFQMARQEAKSLVNSTTGSTDAGAIYLATPTA